MFCTSCAASNDPTRAMCDACGARLGSVARRAKGRRSGSGPARAHAILSVVLLAFLTAAAGVGSFAALGQFAARDGPARERDRARALLAGDLRWATHGMTAPGDEPDAALSALMIATDDARTARAAAVAAMALGDWDAASEALGPVVRALPGNADARDLLVAAREQRVARWQTDERRAARDGDALGRERALASLAVAHAGDAEAAARLRTAMNVAPLVLARDRALWLAAPDGTMLGLVANGPPVTRPIWSPDRSLVAFIAPSNASGRDPAALYVVAPDGTGLRRVYGFAHPNAVPSWSPDGASIALTSVADWDLRTETGLLTVRVVDVETGRSTDISAQTGGHGTSPAWSPDGRFVAFIGRPIADEQVWSPLSGPSEVWIWDADDGAASSLTGDRTPGANRLLWSPIGDQLLVLTRARGQPGEPASALATILGVDPMSGAIEEIAGRIAASTSSWAPAWSPDGRWLAWVDMSGEVVLRNRSGNETKIAVRRFLSGALTWSPGSESLFALPGDPSQPASRIDGIGGEEILTADVDLPYDGEWPTGSPQWSPPWPAPAAGPITVAGTGLDRGG